MNVHKRINNLETKISPLPNKKFIVLIIGNDKIVMDGESFIKRKNESYAKTFERIRKIKGLNDGKERTIMILPAERPLPDPPNDL